MEYASSFSVQFYKALTNWLGSYNLFDTFVTYRPLKTKITGYNAPKLFLNVMDRLPSIEHLFWVVEGDRNPVSNHAHIMFKADGVNKQMLANAMKRNQKEIKYFDKIKDVEGALIYANKYLKSKHFRAWEYIRRDKAQQQIDEQWANDNLTHSQIMDTHPNKEYHRKAQFNSEFFYGWGKMKDRFTDKITTTSYSRKDGLDIDTKFVNESREAVKREIKKSL